jgi:integrase
MASITKKKQNNKFKGYEVRLANRAFVWLGKVSKADANSINSKLTSLERSHKAGLAPEPTVIEWLNKLDEKMKAKLAKCGLIEADDRQTVQQVFDRELERSEAVPATKRNMRSIFETFTSLYGNKLIEKLTEDDLFNFKNSLYRLQESTRFMYWMRVRGVLNKSKGFDTAIFDAVKVSQPKVDFTSREFIDRDEIRAVIAKVGIEYGAILACAGLLGRRCRSEPAALRWEHLNFDKGFITVPAVKTASRITPIYADAAEVLRRYHANRGCSETGLVFPNLPVQSTLYRRIKKAFGRQIDNPYQRLRSSCESYLVNDTKFALTDVSRWLGHDPITAMKYYNQSTPETLERALTLGA